MTLRAATILRVVLMSLEIWGAAARAETELPPFLVKDLNVSTRGSDPEPLVDFGSYLFFSASTAANGTELFRSDGTETGTTMVKDLVPGAESSFPRDALVLNGSLFFIAVDANQRNRLWRSDGTEAGTVLLTEASIGPIASLQAAGRSLFFIADSGGTVPGVARPALCADELWTSDGFEPGPVLVKRFAPSALWLCLSHLASAGQTLVFVVQDGYRSPSLWRSDGTGDGTFPLKELGWPGASSLDWLTTVDGVLFFVAHDAEARAQLWRSDGSVEGTVLVHEPAAHRGVREVRDLTAVEDTLFFVSGDTVHGQELWKSDGTPEGTMPVRDIRPGETSSFPHDLRDVNGELFFAADDGVHGDEPWRSDGTEEGTVLVMDTVVESDWSSPADFTAAAGGAFFVVSPVFGAHPSDELWYSDGTSLGTRRVRAFRDRYGVDHAPYRSIERLASASELLFFRVDDPFAGSELWVSDGTEPGTRLVADLNRATNSASPEHLVDVDGTLYFTTSDPSDPANAWQDQVAPPYQELWRSDGTAEGTLLITTTDWVSDAKAAGEAHHHPPPTPPINELAGAGGVAFFARRDSQHGTELWRVAGPNGVALVKDIVAGTDSSNPQDFVAVDDRLLFIVKGSEIWSSDGSESGTGRVWAPNEEPEGDASTRIGTLEVTDGRVFFVAARSDAPLVLWATDGTEAGTRLVLELAAEVNDARSFVTIGEDVFFSTASGTGAFLWRTDGTEAGTTMLRGFRNGARGSWPLPLRLTSSNGRLIFAAADERGLELWQSDGTAAGTVLVKDINRGPADSVPQEFASVGETTFFSADDGENGAELWKTDGTEAGTRLVMDINPGSEGSAPAELAEVSGRLLFSACDPAGCEPWTSSGSANDTHMLADLSRGAFGSYPGPFVLAHKLVFFPASDVHGRELWALPSASLSRFDCDADGMVTVRDLVEIVAIVLGDGAREACPSGDRNGDGTIAIDDVLAAISTVLAL